MAARLTDKQKKEVIADRAEGMSIRRLAEKYHTSPTTIHRTLKSDPETERKVTEKKEQNTQDVLAHMDAKTGKVIGIIDSYLEALGDPEKISDATLVQLSTALGTLIDKWTMTAAKGGDVEDLMPLADMLAGKDGEK